jgi:hypothetical protein
VVQEAEAEGRRKKKGKKKKGKKKSWKLAYRNVNRNRCGLISVELVVIVLKILLKKWLSHLALLSDANFFFGLLIFCRIIGLV